MESQTVAVSKESKGSVISNIRSNTGRELLPLMMITMSKSEESINILYNSN